MEFELVGLDDIAGKRGPITNEKNLLGRRLELKWSSGRWYRGTVCGYDKASRRHFVVYDDGDRKWYSLREMVVRFIREEDEWIDIQAELDEVKEAENL